MERENKTKISVRAPRVYTSSFSIAIGVVLVGAFIFFAVGSLSGEAKEGKVTKGKKAIFKSASSKTFVPPGLAKKFSVAPEEDPEPETEQEVESEKTATEEPGTGEQASDPQEGSEPEPQPEPEPGPELDPEPEPEPASSFWGIGANDTLQEAGSSSGSASGNWWLNSGGYFTVTNGIGATVQGELPSSDRWRELYSQSNPLDTDNGYHPQNIFRLVTKSSYQNVEQSGYFRINRTVTSSSPNRAGHNGLLFFNRYIDGNSLYYTGLRVDGRAVIKKKLNGTYYTLASGKILDGVYEKNANPNLLPENKWIGIKSIVTNNSGGSVSIKVYADMDGNGTWTLVVEANDSGANGAPITQSGRAGLRTDFMDVEFKDYSLLEK